MLTKNLDKLPTLSEKEEAKEKRAEKRERRKIEQGTKKHLTALEKYSKDCFAK